MKCWIQDVADFVARHWGDVIALLILYTGIVLVVAYGQEKLGEALITASLLALKLRPNPKNGSAPLTPNGSAPLTTSGNGTKVGG